MLTARSLPDPHGIAALKNFSGLDKPVVDFFEQHKAQIDRFLDAAEALVRQSIDAFLVDGRDYLQVAFGCHGGVECSVESVFQASKVFDGGVGPFPELYSHDSREVRHHVQEASAGHRLLAFDLDGVRWNLEPKTAFFYHLYIKVLLANPKLAEELREFDAFTDIEFNPNRQVNCQAAAAAFYVSLCRTGKLEEAMSSREAFLRML